MLAGVCLMTDFLCLKVRYALGVEYSDFGKEDI